MVAIGVSRRWRGDRLAESLTAGVLIASLAGCSPGTSAGTDAATGMPMTKSPATAIAPAGSIGPFMSAYCEIQGLRQLIADGDVDSSALPDFVDKTVVEGTPLIVDFTEEPPADLDAFRDRLFATPELAGVSVDRDAQRECLRTTTDADIEKSQGGPGYLAASKG